MSYIYHDLSDNKNYVGLMSLRSWVSVLVVYISRNEWERNDI